MNNLDLRNLFGVFSENFIKGGLLIGITITIIEFIYKSNNLIGLYAFCTASFFIIQTLQYQHITTKNIAHVDSFLLHSLIGGLVWILYVLLLGLLHYQGVSPTNNVIIGVVVYILICICYSKFMRST
jgi:hypothetical protein